MRENGWGGPREGSGRKPLDEKERKKGFKLYMDSYLKNDVEIYGKGKTLSEKIVDLIASEIANRKLDR